MRKLRKDEVTTYKTEDGPLGKAHIERPYSKKGKKKGTTEGTRFFN